MKHPAATLEIAQKVLTTVNAGLVSGLGEPVPGRMCVEAAVCYAMDLPHSDRPTCVGEAVRRFKIKLNDARWSSNEARTDGLRKLAIAQLGSDAIDQKAFARIVTEQTIRKIVPVALRAAGERLPSWVLRLEAAAVRCEQEGTGAAARDARDVARQTPDAAYAADAYAYVAAAAADAYAADAYVADAYAADAYVAAAYAAAAADAAAAAAAVADAADAAAAAADAADDAAAAYAYGGGAARDSVLRSSCQIGLDALIELQSPGCEFLYLVEDVA